MHFIRNCINSKNFNLLWSKDQVQHDSVPRHVGHVYYFAFALQSCFCLFSWPWWRRRIPHCSSSKKDPLTSSRPTNSTWTLINMTRGGCDVSGPCSALQKYHVTQVCPLLSSQAADGLVWAYVRVKVLNKPHLIFTNTLPLSLWLMDTLHSSTWSLHHVTKSHVICPVI